MAKEPVHSDLVSIGGKTDTALISSHGDAGYRTSGEVYMAPFCGYFLSDHPKYSCAILVVSPHGPGRTSGGMVADGGVKHIAEEIYALSNPVLLGTITPYPANERLKHLDSAGGERKRVENSVKTYKIPEVRPEEGGKIVSDQLVMLQYGRRGLKLQPLLRYAKGVMPRLVGLAPDEAVYQIGLQRLGVQLVGYGRVMAQSIPVDTPTHLGQKVILYLGNNYRQ